MSTSDPLPSPSLLEEAEVPALHRWLAMAAALLAWGFDGVEQNIYSLMTREALKDLVPSARGLGSMPGIDTQLGWFFGISIAMWLWGAAVGGIVFGRMGDRFGRVRGLLISVTTYSLFTGLSALSHHWIPFMFCRFFGAMGLGGTWPLAVALVVESWPQRYRTVLAGTIGAAANVGFFLAAVYSQVMRQHGASWRSIIGMGMVIGLLSLPVICLAREPEKWKRSRDRKERSGLRELFSPQYRRSTIVGSLLATVALLGTWGSFLWLATYIDQLTQGTSYAATGKTMVSQWQSLGQIVGGFLGGLLAGWLGNRRSWIIICICAWLSVEALFGFSTEFHPHMALLAAIAGIFVTAYFGWLPKYLPELYPTRIRASGQGFAYNIGRVLAGVGVLLTGQLVRVFHGDYRCGAMVMACVFFLGVIVIQFAPDTGGRMKEETSESDKAGAFPVGE